MIYTREMFIYEKKFIFHIFIYFSEFILHNPDRLSITKHFNYGLYVLVTYLKFKLFYPFLSLIIVDKSIRIMDYNFNNTYKYMKSQHKS